MKSALATRHEYHKGNTAYVAFNGMHLLALEPHTDGTLRDLLANPTHPSMSNNEYPYAAFVLRALSCKDRHVRRLVFPTDDIPHVVGVDDEGRQVFTLDPSVVESWRRFEGILSRIVHCVHEVTPDFNLVQPQPPSFYRYRAPYESYERLRRHVLAARKAFDLYIAWAVYAVTIRTSVGHIGLDCKEYAESWPKWCEVAIKDEDGHVKADWIHSFLFSQAFDFNSGRAGVFISPHTCSFIHEIPFFLRAGVPFTMVWSLDIGDHGLPLSDALPSEVKLALQRTSEAWGTPVDWSQAVRNAGSISNTLKSKDALPQNVYHWMDFFLEREMETRLNYANQELSNNQVYTHRVRRHNARFLTTFKQGVAVYLWEFFSEHPPLWRRRKIEGQRKNIEWDDHQDHERVYCEFRDEWDLCKPMTEGMPPPPERKLRPPSDSGSVNTIESVEDEVLRPYLKHPVWQERYVARSKLEHLVRNEICPAREIPSPIHPRVLSVPLSGPSTYSRHEPHRPSSTDIRFPPHRDAMTHSEQSTSPQPGRATFSAGGVKGESQGFGTRSEDRGTLP